MVKLFYLILANCFVASVTTTLVWFALGLWVYAQTQSVLATSLMYGIYMVSVTLTGIWFGSLVDRHKKKSVMIVGSLFSLATFIISFILYLLLPEDAFLSHSSIGLWALILISFSGVIVGGIRNIVVPTLVTLLVEEDKRDNANGVTGTMMGLTFLVVSIISGFLLATSGMYWIYVIAIVLLAISIIHLFFIDFPEKLQPQKEKEHHEEVRTSDYIKTFRIIKAIPGLFALILFTCFNNFLGGVFMPLMDPYGLSLVSLQVWGVMWGFLSLGFILGGVFIAKFGLGKNPVRTLFVTNIVLWTIGALFTIQPSIVLLAIGLLLYISTVPFVEASEHTIIQKIVPKERQGRVFGFAQSIETAASPLMTFVIGPIAQFFFIPFMTTGAGVDLIGWWFGTGPGRGIALVFVTAGITGLIITLLAMNSKQYTLLSSTYTKKQD